MTEPGPDPPRFARAIWGYDRGQVDAYLAEHHHAGQNPRQRVEELEAQPLGNGANTFADRRRRDDATRQVEQARQEVEQLVEAVQAVALVLTGAEAGWSQVQLERLRHDLEGLEEQREATLTHLAHVRGSLADMTEAIGGE